MEYTKGEWKLRNIQFDHYQVYTQDENDYEDVIVDFYGIEADARLIAKSPRMYEAICSALVEIEDGSANHAHLILSQAIAKS